MEGKADDAVPDHIVEDGDVDILGETHRLLGDGEAVQRHGFGCEIAGEPARHIIDHEVMCFTVRQMVGMVLLAHGRTAGGRRHPELATAGVKNDVEGLRVDGDFAVVGGQSLVLISNERGTKFVSLDCCL